MKIVNNGFIGNKKFLPENKELPEDAVGFKAPEMRFDVTVPTFVFIVLSTFLVWIIFSFASYLRGDVEVNLMNFGALMGLIIGIMSVPIQGMIRGRYHGENAVINVYFTLRFIYTICYEPIPKDTFIRMGLFPSIMIGWIPLIISAILPMPALFVNFLFTWGFVSIIFSSVYYTSVYCALKQMPNGSMATMSRDEYYWFMP